MKNVMLTIKILKLPIFYLSEAWRLLRRYPIISVFLIFLLLFTGIFADLIAPHDPIKQNLRSRNAPGYLWDKEWYAENPKAPKYLLGGDHIGRDVLSRTIHGARLSLITGGTALVTGITIGTTLALIAGYFGGHIDEIILRFLDIWYALPFLLIAMVAVIIFGASFALVVILLALVAWSATVRNVRAEVLTLRERDYVLYSRVAGASHFRIIITHIFPGVINTVVVIASLRVGSLILSEASLSFLGAGIPSPTPAWGLMISEGRAYVDTAWWSTVVPGISIMLVIISLSFFGDWLRDRLDPRLTQLD
jgi:peptide/nickel transport system permease protein